MHSILGGRDTATVAVEEEEARAEWDLRFFLREEDFNIFTRDA